MENIVNNPKNDPIFAIGNRKDAFSKAVALGRLHGIPSEEMKQIYKQYNPNITQEQLNAIDILNSGASKLVGQYVHDTYPGRVLASELQMGNVAKGVSIDAQREANAASLAFIRSASELNKKMEDGLREYRSTHGQDAQLQDFRESDPGKKLVTESAKALEDKFPKYFKRPDKFTKYKNPTPSIEVGKAQVH